MDKQLTDEQIAAKIYIHTGLSAQQFPDEYEEVLNLAHDLLLSSQSQIEAAQWVSVKDRLPKEGEIIFATGPKYNDCAKYGRYYATVRFAKGEFYDEETGDDIYPPSHWMRIAAVPDSALASSPAEQKGNV